MLAAAAVAVGGFALTPLLTGSGGDSEMGMDAATSGSADSAAEEAAGGSTHSGSDGLLDRDSESAPSPGAIADEVDPQRAPAPPALRPAQLAEDVAALLELGSPPDGEVPVETAADRADGKAQLERDGRMALYSAKGCQAPPAGTWWLVRYDDRRAVLAVVPSAQGGDAIVWPCRGDEPLARVSLAD